MVHEILVDNIKCAGCAHSIIAKLTALAGVASVQVDVEAGLVCIDADQAVLNEAKQVLARLGYPELGSVSGLEAVGAKAKSFVSCAIGKVSKE
jgi:copper chaperone